MDSIRGLDEAGGQFAQLPDTVFNFTKASKPSKLGGAYFIVIETRKDGKFVKIENKFSSLSFSQAKGVSAPTAHDAICILKQLPSEPLTSCKSKEKQIIEDLAQEILVQSGCKIKGTGIPQEACQGIDKKAQGLVSKFAEDPMIRALLNFRDEIRLATDSHKLYTIQKYGVNLEGRRLDIDLFLKKLAAALCKDISKNISQEAMKVLGWDISKIEGKIIEKYKRLSQGLSKLPPYDVFSPLFSYKTYLSDFFLDQNPQRKLLILSELLNSSKTDPSCLNLLFDETSEIGRYFFQKSIDIWTQEDYHFLKGYQRFIQTNDEGVYSCYKVIQSVHFAGEDAGSDLSGLLDDGRQPINISAELFNESKKINEESSSQEVRKTMTSIANHILHTLSMRYMGQRAD